MLEKWKLLDEKTLLKSPPFNVLEKKYEKPQNSGQMTAYILDLPDWVNIIGLTKDQKILVIEQFRFGTDSIEAEIPGGCIDAGEEPLAGAKRELEEETGYISNKWTQIGVVNSNPAILNNKCYTFLAEDIKPSGEIHFDPDEMIEHTLVSLSEVQNLINAGKITNTFIIAAFMWLLRFKNLDLNSF